MKSIIAIISISLFLSACGNNKHTKRWTGVTALTLGGITYALTKDEQATIVATGFGAALGNHIGSTFDTVDALKEEVLSLNQDLERSQFKKVDAETGKEILVEIEPTQTFQNEKFQQCREYTYAYTEDSTTNHGSRVACLQSDGRWTNLDNN